MIEEELVRRHKAFMKYNGNDVISLILHATDLQVDMLAEIKRLRKGIKKALEHQLLSRSDFKEIIE